MRAFPAHKALVKRNEGKAFTFIGIDTNDSEEAYRAGVKKHGLPWISAFQGDDGSPISDQYRVPFYPTVYVLDEEGRIAAKNIHGDALSKKVDELLAALEEKKKGQ